MSRGTRRIFQRTFDVHASAADMAACLRKIRHRSEAKALSRAARAVGRNGARLLRVYRCPACHGWHLTHRR